MGERSIPNYVNGTFERRRRKTKTTATTKKIETIMSLESLTKEITATRKSQENTETVIDQLYDLFAKRFQLEDRQRLKELEMMREAQKQTKVNFNNNNSRSSSGGGGGMLGGLPGMLRGMLGPLALGGLASLTGLDAALKALKLPSVVTNIKSFLKGFKNVFDALPKVKIEMPDIPKLRFLTAAGDAITEFIDYKIKLPALRFMDGAGKAIDAAKDFIDYKIKLPAIQYKDAISGKIIGAVQDINMPKLPKITVEFPKMQSIQTFTEGVMNIIGNFPDGGTGVAGKGILGVIGSIFNILKPALKPLEFIMKTALRPFTQIVLTVIDFVQGFYEGFNSGEDGDTFGQKLLAGVEGGVIGVIKGITEAFDLLFFTVPAWLLEKFGMDNMAEILRGFSFTDLVDPLWAGIKGVVGFVADNFILMKDIIVADFEIQITKIVTGVKNAFSQLTTFVANIGDELYLMLSENLQFTMPKLAITLPWPFNKEIVITEGFTAGVGDASSRASAQASINRRNASRDSNISRRNNELADMMQAQRDRLTTLGNAFQNQVVNAVNDARVTNNNDTTVMNAPAMPFTTEASVPF